MALYVNKNKMRLQPRERFELSNPGFQDQCSNHWANEADTLVFWNRQVKQTKKQTKKNSKERQP